MIEPQAPGRHIYSRMHLPRLGAVLLSTLARDRGWQTSVFVEDVAPVQWQTVLRADLVGISTITGTASRAYAIADALRARGIQVIMGGPHVTFCAEEALSHCDFVLRGEAEQTFMQFLDAAARGKPVNHIAGLSYMNPAGELVHNPAPETVVDLDDLPAPDFTLIHGWGAAHGLGAEPIIPVQSTRGCPFGCTFCSVIGMFGRRLRTRSRDHVMAELEKWRGQGVHAFFYDDNFTANRTAAKRLLRAIEDSPGLLKSWSSQVRTDCATDPDMLALMHKTHCSHVFIGFESVNPKVLQNTHKQQDVAGMKLAVRRLTSAGVDVHGMFVFGFDGDTPEMMEATLDFAIDSGIWSAQFLILTPFPGTPLHDGLIAEGRIHMKDYSFYDAHHVVFEPHGISALQLQQAQIRAHDRFYSRARLARGLLSRDWVRTALFVYARKLNADWQSDNEAYLKTLEAAETPNLQVTWDMSYLYPDISAEILRAAAEIEHSVPGELRHLPIAI
jgi:radical SAM superfamily enzyme YgiQ (UPF0313 family)